MAGPQVGSPNPGAKRALPSKTWARQDFKTQTSHPRLTELEAPTVPTKGRQILHDHVKREQLCFRHDIQAGQAQRDIDQGGREIAFFTAIIKWLPDAWNASDMRVVTIAASLVFVLNLRCILDMRPVFVGNTRTHAQFASAVPQVCGGLLYVNFLKGMCPA